MDNTSIEIQKTVYSQADISVVVDRSFKTFTAAEEEIDTDTVEELFRLYDKLYIVIPVEGDSYSHEYLVKQSSALLSFDSTSEDLELLMEEISQLRSQLLTANQEISNLQTQVAANG